MVSSFILTNFWEIILILSTKMKWMLSFFVKKYFWKIYVEYLSTLKRGYIEAIDKDNFLFMLRKKLQAEVCYNIPNFETAWNNLKDKISIGIFFNAFCKEDVMQEIWDISYNRRLQRLE